ncbi:Sensor histidine kinase [Vulgatibacter incomptus]|uniref:histidine kinase n=2 Tax=Vulgatibacter incomptus TaxID=1391653 RepID=A0A0K1PC61_9BACT|nr:Sensor histidine kinase [Vulgatibacter incomptus]
MAWLVRLRWTALSGVLFAALLAPFLGIDRINVPVLLGAVAAGALYNAYLVLDLREHPDRTWDPFSQAVADFGALTVVLWASGGVRNPFISLYFVHVLLVSVLSGRRAALAASAVALLCAGLLVAADAVPFLRISSFTVDPNLSGLLDTSAFVVTLLAAAYVANRAASELELRRREAKVLRRAQERDAEILLAALDRLEVGVEILQPDGSPTFRNRHLLEGSALSPACPRHSQACETSGTGCPVDEARDGRSGSCRFSRIDAGGRERVIELLSFPLSDDLPAPVLRLHLDRTESVLAERKLLFAERLASLGRTVQAVAHELNTPLATIQTLAADMRAALESAPPEAAELAKDLDESALVILDEMRRCRAITQDLLAGREQLNGGAASGPANVAAAVRRASTLVFGTSASRNRLVLDPALDRISVWMGPDSLVQVFVNLLQNAADVIAARADAKVKVHGLARDGRVSIFVDDEGPGLPPGAKDRVFEAFYTTKPPGKGTGLGLYTALSLVREAGGELALGPAPGGGARATLELPTLPPRAAGIDE